MSKVRRAGRQALSTVKANVVDLLLFLALAFINVGAWVSDYRIGLFVTGFSFLALALLATGLEGQPRQPGQQPPDEP